MKQFLNAAFATRTLYFLSFFACVALLAYAYYSQYVMGLEPCPLCITQRFFMLLVGLTALIAAVHQPKNWLNKIYPLKMIIFALAGAFFAGRMVWLQNLPADQAPSCGPGSLEYILNSFDIWDGLQVLIRGTGDCSKVVWTFLNLSMPAWVLITFIGFTLAGLFQLIRPK